MTASETAKPKEPDFFAELLDAIDLELGFESWDQAQAEELLKTIEPVPIDVLAADEVAMRLRRATGPSASTPPRSQEQRANRRSNRRRLWLPLSTLVLAAATIAYCRWEGTYSTKTLSYEHAFQVLFDQTYTEDQRHSAHAVIYVGMKSQLNALHEVVLEGGPLGTSATQALDRARLLIAGTIQPATIPGAPGPLSNTQLITQFTNRALPTAERQVALQEAIRLFDAGVQALREVEAKDPALKMDSEIVFLKLVNILDGKPPNEIQWKPR